MRRRFERYHVAASGARIDAFLGRRKRLYRKPRFEKGRKRIIRKTNGKRRLTVGQTLGKLALITPEDQILADQFFEIFFSLFSSLVQNTISPIKCSFRLDRVAGFRL